MTQALANGTASIFVSPAVTADLTLWVRISNPAGYVDSTSVQVRVVEQAPTVIDHPSTPGTAANSDPKGGGSGGCGNGTFLSLALAGGALVSLRLRRNRRAGRP